MDQAGSGYEPAADFARDGQFGQDASGPSEVTREEAGEFLRALYAWAAPKGPVPLGRDTVGRLRHISDRQRDRVARLLDTCKLHKGIQKDEPRPIRSNVMQRVEMDLLNRLHEELKVTTQLRTHLENPSGRRPSGSRPPSGHSTPTGPLSASRPPPNHHSAPTGHVGTSRPPSGRNTPTGPLGRPRPPQSHRHNGHHHPSSQHPPAPRSQRPPMPQRQRPQPEGARPEKSEPEQHVQPEQPEEQPEGIAPPGAVNVEQLALLRSAEPDPTEPQEEESIGNMDTDTRTKIWQRQIQRTARAPVGSGTPAVVQRRDLARGGSTRFGQTLKEVGQIRSEGADSKSLK